MANYNLVVNTSSFKPYDILGMYLPILTAEKNQYDKNVESLDKIAIENGLYIPPDGKYKDMKDLYTADLMDIASKVSNGELSTRAVNDIRRRYYKDIVPIDKAAEAYNKYQDKLTALGPDAIIGNNLTFDDFYGNKNQQIEYRSAKTIQNTAAGVMQGLDNALMRSPEIAGKIAKQYFILKQLGLDSSKALSTILLLLHNPMNLQTAGEVDLLILALDGVYNTFNKDSFSDDAKSKIWENTILGAIQGIQAPKYSMLHNQEYLNPAQQYNLDQARKEDKFKYKYDDKTGAIVGWNNDYLTGAYSGRGRGAGGVTERVPNGGAFHSTKTGKKEEDIASSNEIERSQVPTHIASQYPDDTKFLICRDAKGDIIGYIGIKYTDRKVQGGSLATETGGTSETNEGDYE